MKKFFALLAVVLAVVSCQKDVDVNVNLGGDLATISVVLPEDAITRADWNGNDSAASGLDNTSGEVVRVIMHIYDDQGRVSDKRYVDYLAEGETTVTFDVRLVPNRQYTFVAWADMVDGEADVDKYFETEDLKAVTMIAGSWDAMNEERDAFTATYTTPEDKPYTSSSNISLTLTRPFAKLRVVTTDMAELNNLNIKPTTATVTYSTKHYNTFNAVEGKAIADSKNRDIKHENFTIASYGENVAEGADMTLFTDYFFATDEQEEVNFSLEVFDQNNRSIKYNNFNTPIPVKRNNLTTIAGNILTEGNNITVTVDPVFAGKQEWPSEEAEKLAAAAMFGGEVTLTENVVLNQPLDVKSNMTLNLGGKTLEGVINVNEAAKLTVNNGTIVNVDKSMSGITSNGDLTLNDVNIVSARHAVRIESGNVVINGGTYEVDPISKSTLHALNVGDDSTVANVTIKGGKFIGPKGTMADSGSALNVRSGSTVTIEGGDFSGGKTKTLSVANQGALTVKGGTFDQDPSNYVAAGYKAIAADGKFAVVAEDVDNVVANKADMKTVLEAAASAGSTNVVVDAMGANIGNLDYGLKTSLVPTGTTVTIRNAVVEGRSYGNGVNGTVIFDGCTFNNSGAYSIHFDNGNGDVIFKNCHLYGWNSFGSSLNSVSFENCTLDGNGTYALIRSYVNLTMTNCVINTSKANHNDVYSEGVEVISPATLTENNVTYVVENYDALKTAIINGGNIEFANDITVDEWIMFSEDLTISNGTIITVENINVSIDGKGHTLTVNSIESAGNNDQLFQGASVLNISNLTIKYADGLTTGGLGMVSGVIKNVHFIGGGSAASSAAIFPNNGKIKVEGCIFDTNGVALYFDDERDNLTVTGCTFNQKDNKNVILLRGDVKFTDNIINSGRTVNVVSGSPVVTGNNFNNVRFKVYGAATATISNNIINNLEFDGTSYASTFTGNTLSDAAQAVLNGATKVN